MYFYVNRSFQITIFLAKIVQMFKSARLMAMAGNESQWPTNGIVYTGAGLGTADPTAELGLFRDRLSAGENDG